MGLPTTEALELRELESIWGMEATYIDLHLSLPSEWSMGAKSGDIIWGWSVFQMVREGERWDF